MEKLLVELTKAIVEKQNKKAVLILAQIQKSIEKNIENIFESEYFTVFQSECRHKFFSFDVFIVRKTNNKIERTECFELTYPENNLTFPENNLKKIKKIVADMEVQENALSHCKN